MAERLGDGPIEDRYLHQMNAIAEGLDRVLNGDTRKGDKRTTGFVLLVFPFGEAGRCNYISNGANREDIVTMMREQIRRFEGAPDVEGHA